MDKILNSLEIPNGLGFEILPESFIKLYKNKRIYSNVISIFEDKIRKILESYGIDGVFDFVLSFSMESINNEKHLYISKIVFFTSFVDYFNQRGDTKILDDVDNIFTSIIVNDDNNTSNKIKNKDIASTLKKYLKERIREIDRINSLEEIKEYCPQFYLNIKRIIKEENYDLLDAHRFFIYSKDRLIKNLSRFVVWADKILEEFNTPIEEELDKYIDKDRFKLFLAGQYTLIIPVLKEPYKTLLLDSVHKLINSIDNKKVSFDEVYFLVAPNNDGNNTASFHDFDLTKLIDLLNQFKEKNFVPEDNILEKYSKEDFEGKSIDQIRDFVLGEIEKTIKIASELGSENVDKDEMLSKMDNLNTKIKSGDLEGKELVIAKHQLQRLKMVLIDVKPRAIQKALPPFTDFYIYYYDNGMVALDKIGYGARLFVMPVSTYKYILDNHIDSLKVVGRLDSVKAFRHSLNKDWLNDAKKALENNENISESDIAFNKEMNDWNLKYNLSNLEELETRIKTIEEDQSLSTKDKTKRIKKIREKAEDLKNKRRNAKNIDNALKSSNPVSEDDLTLKDTKELSSYEEELDKKFGTDEEFEVLYNATKGKKYKRNPAVSKYGKDRTIDENGMYHCELCDSSYSIEQKSRLDYHHVVPISKGGPDTIYNGLCLCSECHRIIHYEPERVSKGVVNELLDKIHKHIKEENPELLEEFYKYKRTHFPNINDLISNERIKLKKSGLSDEVIEQIIKRYELSLQEDYKRNPKKYIIKL